MEKTIDFAELEELKIQFNLLNEKLEKQQIINENLIKESMKKKIIGVERWYRARFRVLITVPILMAIFASNDYHVGYITLLAIVALFEFVLNWKCYRTLNTNELPTMTITSATECVVKHKQMRALAKKILIAPWLMMVIWTIMIASGYSWNLPLISITIVMMILGSVWGHKLEKKNRRNLEDVLHMINKMRR